MTTLFINLLIYGILATSYFDPSNRTCTHLFHNMCVVDGLENDVTGAAYDIAKGFFCQEICICFDASFDAELVSQIVKKFVGGGVAVKLFNITSVDVQDIYFDFLERQVKDHLEIYTMFFCARKFYEHALLEIRERDVIRRNVVYVFFWGGKPLDRFFVRSIHHVMKVYVVTHPRGGTFRIYYNQALAYKKHHLEMVNWWQHGVGLFYHPTLPAKYNKVFKDFKGKLFKIPVIHKPPWHFVHYTNDSIEVLGGRDDRIISLIAEKLNFRYEYFDPPERIQGSSGNGTFQGVLGLIWKRVL